MVSINLRAPDARAYWGDTGTAPDRETAEQHWKAVWPAFCAKRTDEDWQDEHHDVELSKRN